MSCKGLITDDGRAPAAYVHFQLLTFAVRAAVLGVCVWGGGGGGTMLLQYASQWWCVVMQEQVTRVVDNPPSMNPIFDETKRFEVPSTVDVLDALEQEPLHVNVFERPDRTCCGGRAVVLSKCRHLLCFCFVCFDLTTYLSIRHFGPDVCPWCSPG